MDTRWTGRDLVRGSQVSWDEVPPADLRLRLNDVLQYEGCTSDDVWEAIRDWLEARGITRSKARPLSLVPHIHPSLRENAIAPVLQAQSAMQLTRLVYTSKHEITDAAAFDSILKSSQWNNTLDSVTGVLVVDDANFLQVIEGSREAIAKCFQRIIADKRHHEVQVIACGDVSRRLFQDWNMRLLDVHMIKQEILSAHFVEGRFQPRIMSEFSVEEFCRAISISCSEVGPGKTEPTAGDRRLPISQKVINLRRDRL